MKKLIYSILLLSVLKVQAANLFVATYGNDSNNGSSTNAANALATIKKARQLATAGTVIYVLGGSYTDPGLLYVDQVTAGTSGGHIVVTNYNATTVTLFPTATWYFGDAGAAYTDFYNITWNGINMPDGTPLIKLTDNGGTDASHTARWITFNSCKVLSNHTGHGVLNTAKYFAGQSNAFFNCEIAHNGDAWTTGHGSFPHGVYASESSLYIKGGSIHHHGYSPALSQTTGYHGYGTTGTNYNNILDGVDIYNNYNNVFLTDPDVSTSPPNIIRNCKIHDPLQANIDFRYGVGGWQIDNNTIYASAAGAASVIIQGSAGTGNILRNNLLTGGQYGLEIISSFVGSVYLTNNLSCDFTGFNFSDSGNHAVPTGGSGNLLGNQYDAGFVNYPTDVHITTNSSAWNAGITISTISTDIDGNPRISGGVQDIGSHELITGATLPAIQFTTSDLFAFEPSTPGTILLLRSLDDTNNTKTVNYQVIGTATNGVNYTTITTNRVFAPGEITKSIVITPIDDAIFHSPNLNVGINLWPSTNYTIVGVTNYTLQIADNDTPNVGRKGPQ